MQPTQQPAEQPTPITEDAHATAPQLLARAHVDYQHAAWKRAVDAEGEQA